MIDTSPRTCVVSCMRNEGQFLLEWVAHYRDIGFDEIIILTNDCDDGMDRMLDRLQDLGHVTHIRNPTQSGQSPQITGLHRAMEHPVVRSCDWMLHVDADEFLRIDHGEGLIGDLLEAMPGHTDLIPLAWLPFGNDGQKDWSGGNVVEKNTRCQDIISDSGFHKTLFRPNKFARAIDHMPKEPFGHVVARNGKGELMNARATRSDFSKFRGNDAHLHSWDGACVHHYMIRADDVFVMKNHRGDGMALKTTKYFLNSNFYGKFNRNDRLETAILRRIETLNALKKTYLSDPILGPLHEAAETWFQKQKSKVLTDDQRAAWTKT